MSDRKISLATLKMLEKIACTIFTEIPGMMVFRVAIFVGKSPPLVF